LGRAHLSATLHLLTCARHPSDGATSPSWLLSPTMAPLPLDHANQHQPTWARSYPHVCDTVENFSLPFTPSQPRSLTRCLLYRLHRRLFTIATTDRQLPSLFERGIRTPSSAAPTSASFQPDSPGFFLYDQPPSSILLRTRNDPEEHRKITLSFLNHSFVAGDHSSVPPSTTSPSSTSSPPLAYQGEPLSIQHPKLGPSPPRLPPRHHLVR
jgi:hypothetical protein